MPFYDYLCERCGPFSARAAMADSGAPSACPGCASFAPRTISAPQLNLMSPTRRRIDSRNEKSAHAPEIVHRPAHAHAHSCAHHGAHGTAGGHSHSHAKAPAGAKGHSHGPARPWMVGH